MFVNVPSDPPVYTCACLSHSGPQTCSFGTIFMAAESNQITAGQTIGWAEANKLCTDNAGTLITDPALARTDYVNSDLFQCVRSFLRSISKKTQLRITAWTSNCHAGECSTFIIDGSTEGPGTISSRVTTTLSFYALCQRGGIHMLTLCFH